MNSWNNPWYKRSGQRYSESVQREWLKLTFRLTNQIEKPHPIIFDSQFAPEEIGWFPADAGPDMDSISVISQPADIDDRK